MAALARDIRGHSGAVAQLVRAGSPSPLPRRLPLEAKGRPTLGRTGIRLGERKQAPS